MFSFLILYCSFFKASISQAGIDVREGLDFSRDVYFTLALCFSILISFTCIVNIFHFFYKRKVRRDQPFEEPVTWIKPKITTGEKKSEKSSKRSSRNIISRVLKSGAGSPKKSEQKIPATGADSPIAETTLTSSPLRI